MVFETGWKGKNLMFDNDENKKLFQTESFSHLSSIFFYVFFLLFTDVIFF